MNTYCTSQQLYNFVSHQEGVVIESNKRRVKIRVEEDNSIVTFNPEYFAGWVDRRTAFSIINMHQRYRARRGLWNVA